MTDLLFSLPGIVAARIKLILPAVRTCEGIAGRFNLERLKTESVQSPAVLVSVLDLKQNGGAAGPVHFFDLSMAAFIVTKDQLGLSRDAAAAAMTTAIAAYVPDRRWGQADCGEARNVRGQSIVNAGFLKSAASLWAVTWTQPCTFTASDVAEPVALELYVGQSPQTGADHVADYTRIGGGA